MCVHYINYLFLFLILFKTATLCIIFLIIVHNVLSLYEQQIF